MHITMIKKRLVDGSDCRKCADVTALLRARGLWQRIDEIVWADEGQPDSPGWVLGRRFGVDTTPFFVVTESGQQTVYTSALQLIRDKLHQPMTAADTAGAVDVDDIGGI